MKEEIPCINCLTFAICKNIYQKKYTSLLENNYSEEGARGSTRPVLYEKCKILFRWVQDCSHLIVTWKIRRDIYQEIHELFMNEDSHVNTSIKRTSM